MCASLAETIKGAEAIVVSKRLSNDDYKQLLGTLQPHQVLIDLVRLNGQRIENFEGEYRGICW